MDAPQQTKKWGTLPITSKAAFWELLYVKNKKTKPLVFIHEEVYKTLAYKVDTPEQWGCNWFGLKNYLQEIWKRLLEQGKVLQFPSYGIPECFLFNTGLQTEGLYDDIFLCMLQNNKQEYSSPYYCTKYCVVLTSTLTSVHHAFWKHNSNLPAIHPKMLEATKTRATFFSTYVSFDL